jgi:hypothetical protein
MLPSYCNNFCFKCCSFQFIHNHIAVSTNALMDFGKYSIPAGITDFSIRVCARRILKICEMMCSRQVQEIVIAIAAAGGNILSIM